MNSCDTAIESLRYKLFEDKHFGYHHGTQWVLTSHEVVPCSHCGQVYITIIRSVWGILGTMIVPKNIFVWKSDIQAFRIWIRNYSIYSGWVLSDGHTCSLPFGNHHYLSGKCICLRHKILRFAHKMRFEKFTFFDTHYPFCTS